MSSGLIWITKMRHWPRLVVPLLRFKADVWSLNKYNRNFLSENPWTQKKILQLWTVSASWWSCWTSTRPVQQTSWGWKWRSRGVWWLWNSFFKGAGGLRLIFTFCYFLWRRMAAIRKDFKISKMHTIALPARSSAMNLRDYIFSSCELKNFMSS